MPASSSRRSQKRLPAFGREILELRLRGLVPVGRVVVALDTWAYGIGRARAVVAQDLDPADLDFRFLAGLDVELVWLPQATPIARRDVAIRAILRYQPRRLLLWAIGETPRLVWIKSVQVGIERAEYA